MEEEAPGYLNNASRQTDSSLKCKNNIRPTKVGMKMHQQNAESRKKAIPRLRDPASRHRGKSLNLRNAFLPNSVYMYRVTFMHGVAV